MQNILMVCAENALVKGAKVGGVADVIAGICPALEDKGCKVQILMPSYGVFHQQCQAKKINSIYFPFYGQHHEATLYYADNEAVGGIATWFIDHRVFSDDEVCGQIYIHDDVKNPFASDATRFALFCAAAAEAIKLNMLAPIDCIHLHDWQGAFLLFLKTYEPHYQRSLGQYPFIFSIHNLGYQGIRPLDNHASSLKAWWPHLHIIDHKVRDNRWADCFNPMAIGIRFADKIHTVSPSYSREILKDSNPQQGYYGGEGLHEDLQKRAEQGALYGIINGCDYSDVKKVEKPDKNAVLEAALQFSLKNGAKKTPADEILYSRLKSLKTTGQARLTSRSIMLTSVGRLSTQKMALLLQPVKAKKSALQAMLDYLGDKGLFLMVGSGEAWLEKQLISLAKKNKNFLFVNGYAQHVAEQLYINGDLFIMPSQYEPCGISQMLAMKHGQPCLVHATGGLKDTVKDNVDGFAFDGASANAQAKALVKRYTQVQDLYFTQPSKWVSIGEAARAKRFLWQDSAAAYIDELYGS